MSSAFNKAGQKEIGLFLLLVQTRENGIDIGAHAFDIGGPGGEFGVQLFDLIHAFEDFSLQRPYMFSRNVDLAQDGGILFLVAHSSLVCFKFFVILLGGDQVGF